MNKLGRMIAIYLLLLQAPCAVAQARQQKTATRLAAPSLSANAVQPGYPGTNKPYCSIVSGSGKTSYVSAVLNDPTDPAATTGIHFTVNDTNATVAATSSDTTVVKTRQVLITRNGTACIVRIIPSGVGYTTINLKASNSDGSSSTYKISYAASAASFLPANTAFQTGTADASATSSIDSNYMLMADDENNVLRLYNRQHSGKELYGLDITSAVGASEECDLEASGTSIRFNAGKRIYWIGSLGNSKSGNLKPDRNKVIATDLSGTGANTTLSVRSYSNQFRGSLITWGNANGWNFTASAASGMIPKRIDGFNVEGLTIANGGDTAYIGFRAPCVPRKGVTPTTANRKYAILAPIHNFETMLNGSGQVSTTPSIGQPILFDLKGLGIRSIERVGNGQYVIVAGLFTGGGSPAVYLWDGIVPANSGSTPIDENSPVSKLIRLNLPGLQQLSQISSDGQAEGHPEAMMAEIYGDTLHISLVCDNGTVDYYGDGNEAKSLSHNEFKKFRTDGFDVIKDSLTTAVVNLCPGVQATFLTAIGNAASYQWQMDTCGTGNCFVNISNNAHFTGANSKVLSINGMPTSWNGYGFRCVTDGNAGNTFTIKYALTWTGAISTAWEQAGNWDCTQVPDANTDVIINSGTAVLNASTQIRSLQSGSTNLTIKSGSNLLIKK